MRHYDFWLELHEKIPLFLLNHSLIIQLQQATEKLFANYSRFWLNTIRQSNGMRLDSKCLRHREIVQ